VQRGQSTDQFLRQLRTRFDMGGAVVMVMRQ
jgi:hypothetical protein